MKKLMSYALVLSLLFAFACKSGEQASTSTGLYKIDVAKSTMGWLGTKPSGKHNGTLSFTKGEINVKDGQVTTGTFEMDMNSIQCLDLQGETAAGLVKHLKGPDFFNVDTFKTGKFVLKQVTALKEKTAEGYTHKVDGDLTLKNITKPVSFQAAINVTSSQVTLKGTPKLNRTHWNINYGSKTIFPSIGEKYINDEIETTFDLVATK